MVKNHIFNIDLLEHTYYSKTSYFQHMLYINNLDLLKNAYYRKKVIFSTFVVHFQLRPVQKLIFR